MQHCDCASPTSPAMRSSYIESLCTCHCGEERSGQVTRYQGCLRDHAACAEILKAAQHNTTLRSLSLRKNCLRWLVDIVGDGKRFSLTELDLAENELQHLPGEFVRSLPCHAMLNFEKNQLDDVPNDIARFFFRVESGELRSPARGCSDYALLRSASNPFLDFDEPILCNEDLVQAVARRVRREEVRNGNRIPISFVSDRASVTVIVTTL